MNKTAPITSTDNPAITEEQVIAFLEQSPDFLLRHVELLPRMESKHEGGSVVPLVEHQIKLLREQNVELRNKLANQHDQAVRNDCSQQRLHKITINMLEASDINHALKGLQQSLASLFKLEFSRVRLFADRTYPLLHVDQGFIYSCLSARKSLDDFAPSANPVCGRLNDSQLKRIFGESADAVASSVFIPLRQNLLRGFIALGSKDAGRYSPDMDTLYLKRLSDTVAIALFRLVE